MELHHHSGLSSAGAFVRRRRALPSPEVQRHHNPYPYRSTVHLSRREAHHINNPSRCEVHFPLTRRAEQRGIDHSPLLVHYDSVRELPSCTGLLQRLGRKRWTA